MYNDDNDNNSSSSSNHNQNNASAACNIPLIDFSPFLVDVVDREAPTSSEETLVRQAAVAKQIDQVNRTHGFLALIHFGITAQERNQAFDGAEKLFALPTEHKLQSLPRINPHTNTGYAPLQSERLNTSRPPDLKEAFNVRFPPGTSSSKTNNNSNNNTTNLEHVLPTWFGPFLETVWLPKMQTLARQFAVACAMALQLPQNDFFAQHLTRFDLCTVRLLHYPPCDWHGDDEEADDDDDNDEDNNDNGTATTTTTNGNNVACAKTALRIGEHTDFGAFTFLFTHPGPDGLQIKSVAGAEVGGDAAGEADGWQDVVLPSTNADDEPILIVNTGALMARWTNDEWNATAHRVIVPNAAVASRSRYSIACFIDPDKDSLVQAHPSFADTATGKEIRYAPITSSDYLLQKLQSMMKK